MPHVGVERLAARDDQEDGAEHREAVPPMLSKEREGMPGIDCGEHHRLFHEPGDAERRDDEEPANHDRTEEPTNSVGAVPLNREHTDDDGHCDRHDVRLKQRRHHLEPLDRAEHGDRRRDHAVAVEKRSAEDPHQDEHRPTRSIPRSGRKQRG